MDICPKCGLPKQACVCEEIAKSEQRITIELVKRRFGKYTTLIKGLGSEINVKETAKELKNELACGGTVKEGVIELQGNHKSKAKQALMKAGFPENSIITT
ncbi:stress response translation initiation inhibitor YciH [Candidatus Pacearchaeota archaeon CG10_big_fil_rev_8_21_14_0_10_35_13]|nr:MAG: stress response translation initiation inhibitor YciH [Candidatus Pacearchaeota archaeon CG10_big_fil_rev_8_21_14_0_10_35_13]